MPITPNTHPEPTTDKNGKVTTVHRSNGASSPVVADGNSRVASVGLPSLDIEDTLDRPERTGGTHEGIDLEELFNDLEGEYKIDGYGSADYDSALFEFTTTEGGRYVVFGDDSSVKDAMIEDVEEGEYIITIVNPNVLSEATGINSRVFENLGRQDYTGLSEDISSMIEATCGAGKFVDHLYDLTDVRGSWFARYDGEEETLAFETGRAYIYRRD